MPIFYLCYILLKTNVYTTQSRPRLDRQEKGGRGLSCQLDRRHPGLLASR